MKRIISLMLIIATMLSCLFIFTSCHGTYSMYEIDNDLSDHGFSVDSRKPVENSDGTINDKLSNVTFDIAIEKLGDELLTDKEKKNLTFREVINRNDYVDEVFETSGYNHILVATSRNKKDSVVAVLFEKKADAKKFEKFISEKLGEDYVDRDRKIVLFSNSLLALDCAKAYEVLPYKLEKNIMQESYVVNSTSNPNEIKGSVEALKSLYSVSFKGDVRYVFNATKKDEFASDELIVVFFEKSSDAKTLKKAVEAKGLNVKRDGKTVIIGTAGTIELAYKNVHVANK